MTVGALAVRTVGLRRSFGDKVALDGVDLAVGTGTVFALLGPNGSGKTTTVQVLSTLVPPTSGIVEVLGHDVGREGRAVRSAIGVTGQFSAVDSLLTGRENLRLMADLQHLSPGAGRRLVDDLLETFDLVDAADTLPVVYSGGMRRRLDLAMTLVGRPRLIFLDEPTAGLDPRSRRALWHVVQGLVADGTTVFLTTQYLEEADQLSDRIAVLEQGRVVAQGTPRELKALVPGGHLVLELADRTTLEVAARTLGIPAPPDGRLLRVPSEGTPAAVAEALTRLAGAGCSPTAMSIATPDLDDVFLALTGRPDLEGSPR